MKTLILRLPLLGTLLFFTHSLFAADTGMHIPMHSKGMSTYYVSGTINDAVQSDFLVDTGSGYVTINEKTLKALKLEGKTHFIKNISAVMANGSETVVPVYRLATLKLGDNCIINNIEAAVMPGSTPNILGFSALKKAAPFSMSVTPPALTLSGCGVNQVVASSD